MLLPLRKQILLRTVTEDQDILWLSRNQNSKKDRLIVNFSKPSRIAILNDPITNAQELS